MSQATSASLIGRYTRIADLGTNVKGLLRRAEIPVAIVAAIVATLLWFQANPGSTCFILIAIGALWLMVIWRKTGVGLPIIPLYAVQNLLAYGLPIIVKNESVMSYPADQFTAAGWEILAFSGALALSWQASMHLIRESSPRCYALQGFNDKRTGRLIAIALILAGTATLYPVGRTLGFLDTALAALPEGTVPILNALTSAIGACGFFLGAMIAGKGGMGQAPKATLWLLLAMNCYFAATSLLLSSSLTLIISVFVGLFWATGRVPKLFLLVVALIFGFLNLGKFQMRDRYWSTDDEVVHPAMTLTKSAELYSEWIAASFESLQNLDAANSRTSRRSSSDDTPVDPGQSLFERIDNLQNVLYVIDAVETKHIAPLGGETYALIPPLLLPRILWPDKPRTHAGQILLNVHFGRQDLRATFQTYIAWGLNAEAYGNYGPIVGNVALGLVLGFLIAAAERFTAPKLLLSLEGLLAFALLIGVANSFEMVASVFVTSIFQSFVPIIVACSPFVDSVIPRQATPTAVTVDHG